MRAALPIDFIKGDLLPCVDVSGFSKGAEESDLKDNFCCRRNAL
jgi:hypothetical protein